MAASSSPTPSSSSPSSSSPAPASFKLLLFLDGTASMSNYIESLKVAFPKIMNILSILIGNTVEIALTVYRDMDCEKNFYEFFGPFQTNQITEFINIMSKVPHQGGGDIPECQKLALQIALRRYTPDAILDITDAFPHEIDDDGHNWPTEKRMLDRNGMLKDWFEIMHLLASKNCKYYTLGCFGRNENIAGYMYGASATITGGMTIGLPNHSVATIAEGMIKMIVQMLGYVCKDDEKGFIGGSKIFSCNKVMGPESRIPYKTITVPMTQDSHDSDSSQSFFPVPSFCKVIDRDNITRLYKTDPEYKSRTIGLFTTLINGPLSDLIYLTYNPLLGCMWRLICVEKSDETKVIVDKMSNLIDAVKRTNPTLHAKISVWLEEAYNQMDKINALFDEIPPGPFLIAQFDTRPTKRDMVNWIQCLLPHHMSKVVEILNSVTLITDPSELVPLIYVPFNLPRDQLFSLISHLVSPGTMMSKIGTINWACISLYIDHVIFAPLALEYLVSIKGTWLNPDESKYYVFAHIKMLRELSKKYDIFTGPETDWIDFYFTIGCLKYGNPDIKVNTLFKLDPKGKFAKDSDDKIQCPSCNHYRSATLITETGSCGICVSEGKEVGVEVVDIDQEGSYLFNCNKCSGIYAVERIGFLNTTPVCHYCRVGEEPVKVKCVTCDTIMISPSGTDYKMCHLCKTNGGEMRIVTEILPLHVVMSLNSGIILDIIGFEMVGRGTISALLDSSSLFSLRDKVRRAEGRTVGCDSGPGPSSSTLTPTPLTYKKQTIINSSDIITQMFDVMRGNFDLRTCKCCFSDFTPQLLHKPCINSDCKGEACEPCIRRWYNTNKIGKRFLINHTKCMFCQNLVTNNGIWRKYNLEMADTMKKASFHFQPGWHYATCKNCLKVKEFMAAECMGPDPDDRLENWICADCENIHDPDLFIECPGCSQKIIKSSGCNRMICVCGTKFCYLCRFVGDTEADVYNHLMDEHGGYY